MIEAEKEKWANIIASISLDYCDGSMPWSDYIKTLNATVKKLNKQQESEWTLNILKRNKTT